MTRRCCGLGCWLTVMVLLVLQPLSCGAGFAPPSQVSTLRVLAVTTDSPYALPGEEVTLRMTVADGLGDEQGAPRDVEVLWLAGCFNPDGDQYYLCFEQMAEQLGALGAGSLEAFESWTQLGLVSGEQSGEPDVDEFSFTIPEDILVGREDPADGLHYGIAFVFFAACAGTLAPGEPAAIESWTGEGTPELPLRCLDRLGREQGADSFVPGYTQVWVFGDGRRNAPPPIDGMTFDGVAIPDGLDGIPTVPPCGKTDAERRSSGCLADTGPDCTGYRVEALVGDVAEIDPESADPQGNPMREIVWLDYFADGGDLSQYLSLVSDPTQGYLGEHHSEWTPPAEPGIVSLWVVARDQRGGSTVIRRFVRVE